MKYKLLCTDIDGTLLNDDKEVSKEDREALRWAYSQGIKIALVTGRMPTSTAVSYTHLSRELILS